MSNLYHLEMFFTKTLFPGCIENFLEYKMGKIKGLTDDYFFFNLEYEYHASVFLGLGLMYNEIFFA